jgi:hypothetical protein
MSDYSKLTDFTNKDSLATTDPLKIILGAEWDDEFDAIQTAVATKYDSADLASEAQAQAGTSNAVLMTPLRAADYWIDTQVGAGPQALYAATDVFLQQSPYQSTDAINPTYDNSNTFTFTVSADKWYYIELFFDSSLNSASGTPGNGICKFSYSDTPATIALIKTAQRDLAGADAHLTATTDTFTATGGSSSRDPSHIVGVVKGHATNDLTMTLQISKFDAGVTEFYVNEGAWMRVIQLNTAPD